MTKLLRWVQLQPFFSDPSLGADSFQKPKNEHVQTEKNRGSNPCIIMHVLDFMAIVFIKPGDEHWAKSGILVQ